MVSAPTEVEQARIGLAALTAAHAGLVNSCKPEAPLSTLSRNAVVKAACF